MPNCTKCLLPISQGGRQELGKHWHAKCFTCQRCNKQIANVYWTYGKMVVCDKCQVQTAVNHPNETGERHPPYAEGEKRERSTPQGRSTSRLIAGPGREREAKKAEVDPALIHGSVAKNTGSYTGIKGTASGPGTQREQRKKEIDPALVHGAAGKNTDTYKGIKGTASGPGTQNQREASKLDPALVYGGASKHSNV